MNIVGISNIGASLQAGAALQKETAEVNSFEEALNNAVKEKNDKELREACNEFESYFINLMFKEMRKTIHTEKGIIPKSNAEEIFEDMLYDEVSKSATRQGTGIGLSDMMYKQLSRDDVYESIPVKG